MITINLLPVREWRRRETVRRLASIYILSMILLITSLVAVGITYQTKIHLQRMELKNLEQEKKQLLYVDRKIKEVKNAGAKVEEKFRAIEKLQKGRTLSLRIMDAFVTAMPIDRLWVEELDLSHQELDVSGFALDNQTVALFMQRLDSASIFDSVKLETTSTAQKRGHDLTRFQLKITISSKSLEPDSEKDGKG